MENKTNSATKLAKNNRELNATLIPVPNTELKNCMPGRVKINNTTVITIDFITSFGIDDLIISKSDFGG
jgi:hypothetical protein